MAANANIYTVQQISNPLQHLTIILSLRIWQSESKLQIFAWKNYKKQRY